MKTGLLQILHGSDLFPGSIINGLEDLLGVLDPLFKRIEIHSHLSFVGVLSLDGPVAP
jgi:hypothetical protein